MCQSESIRGQAGGYLGRLERNRAGGVDGMEQYGVIGGLGAGWND